MHRNGVSTTSIGLLAALLVLGGAIGWSAVAVIEATGRSVSPAPWVAPGSLLFFAGLLFVGAWYMYDRVHRKRVRVDPLYAFRLLVLAKASALVGALVCGGYAGFVLRFLPDWGVNAAGRERVITGLVAAGTALVLVIAGLLLERACKRPKDELAQEAEEENNPPD